MGVRKAAKHVLLTDDGGSEKKKAKRSDGLIPCFEWDRSGACKYADKCKFSHMGEQDDGSGNAAARRRKSVCFAFVDGNCERGDTCRYRHISAMEASSSPAYLIARALAAKGSQEEKLAQIMKLPE